MGSRRFGPSRGTNLWSEKYCIGNVFHSLICETELAAEFLPVADGGFLDQSKLYFITGLCDCLESLSLFLGNGLVVAELDCAGTIVAGSDDDGLDIAGNKTGVDQNLLHIHGIFGNQEIIIFGLDNLFALRDELIDTPYKGLLVGSEGSWPLHH